jgi:hypothetical protein
MKTDGVQTGGQKVRLKNKQRNTFDNSKAINQSSVSLKLFSLENSIKKIGITCFGFRDYLVEGRGKGFFSPHKNLGTKESLR